MALSEKHETLTEILAARGYQTAAVVRSFVLDAKFGLDQGFASYHNDFELEGATLKLHAFAGHALEAGQGFDRRADVTTQLAIEALERQVQSDSPFFLFVHYMDPHRPYVPPERFADRFVPKDGDANVLDQEIGRYDAKIAFTDHEIAKVLQALNRLGVRRQTLVVITSDHGEGLMQHGVMGHGYHIYDEGVLVPLIFRWPGRIPPGQVFTSAVELVDVTITILDLLGHSPGGVPVQGRSLAGAILGTSTLPADRPVFLHRRHYDGDPVETDSTFAPFRRFRPGNKPVIVKGTRYGVRHRRWKFIQGGEDGPDELFDLDEYPQELKNLSSGFLTDQENLRIGIQAMRETYTFDDDKNTPRTIAEGDLRRLRSMGYVQ